MQRSVWASHLLRVVVQITARSSIAAQGLLPTKQFIFEPWDFLSRNPPWLRLAVFGAHCEEAAKLSMPLRLTLSESRQHYAREVASHLDSRM